MGRGSSFAIAIAVAVAFGLAAVARAASPAEHVVRIDHAGDERLDGLTSAIRAELLAAGFKIAPQKARARSGETTAESAVITLTVDGARALVVASADGAASSFSAEVACTEAGAARRDVNRVALQVAEWLAAIWLPPPAVTPAPAAPAGAAAPAPAPSSSEPAVAAPPSIPAPEAVVPPPFVAAPVAPVAAATAEATLRATSGSPVAASRTLLFDFGVGVLRSPDFGSQFGFELGAALHGTSPIIGGATPFARLALGLYWMGSGSAWLPSSNYLYDVNFATLGGAAGLRVPLVQKISLEGSAGFGLTAVWVVVNVSASSTGGVVAFPSDRTWVATPGGALALVYGFSQRWALAAEARASWMVPKVVFVTGGSQIGGSSAPLITGTLALRIAF